MNKLSRFLAGFRSGYRRQRAIKVAKPPPPIDPQDSWVSWMPFSIPPGWHWGIGVDILGRAKKKELSGNDRIQAEQGGYLPYSYQAVKWFFIFLPVFPLGTYRVMKSRRDWVDWLWPKYRVLPVQWDWVQVFSHYLIFYGGALLIWLALVATGY